MPPTKKTKPTPTAAKKPATARSAAKPRLLSGGNPQIKKGDGDAPVQAYIAAMPGWKRDLGRRLDALIERTVPGVQKAVKWNSPFYGVKDQGWFLGIHCFAKYVKVAFFRGTSLRPLPPGESKSKETRYLDIREDEPLDEKQFAAWVKQASRLPGEQVGGEDAMKKKTKRAAAARRAAGTEDASARIDARIAELGDWRGATLATVRGIIRRAVPAVVEEWKWRGVPVWSSNGILCTGESYRAAVKLTFANGASLPDPRRLFNASLEGSTRRAIDIHEGESVDAKALTALVQAAANWNAAKKGKAAPRGRPRASA